MKNLKVAAKLIVAFALIIVLYLTTVVISVVEFTKVQNEVVSFAEGAQEIRSLANQAMREMESLQKYCLLIVATNYDATMAEADASAADAAAALKGYLEQIYALPYLNEYNNVIQACLDDLPVMAAARAKITELGYSFKNEEAANLFESDYRPVALEVRANLETIQAAAVAEANSAISEIESTVTSAIVIMLIVAAASVIVTIVMATIITRCFTVPIAQIKTATESMQHGQMKGVVVDYESKDELGQLSASVRDVLYTLNSYVEDVNLNMKILSDGDFVGVKANVDYRGQFIEMRDSILRMVDVYNSTLLQIKQVSDQVANGSGQVAGGAQAMAQGATEQASSVEQLAASINQISDQVRHNAETASELNEAAISIGNNINQSNSQMQDMIRAMDEISTSSSEISKIIKTIDDIAFQTNILALNAAVEAARAGEAGKGFAVVADEVRNLASKSAEAAKSTTELIESTVRAVDNGTQIASSTAASLEKVVAEAQEITSGIAKISQASEEQAEAITQVTLGVDQISTVVQTNSATAEESAATSQELSGQARMLDELLQQFKLKA